MNMFYTVAFCAALLVAAGVDVKVRKIPDSVCIVLLLAGAGRLLTTGPPIPGIVSAAMGLLIGGLPLLIVSLITGGVGGGDIKLAASAGFFLGWFGSYLALLCGSILFLAAGVARRLIWKIPFKTSFPFGPFYAAGGIGAYLLSEVMK